MANVTKVAKSAAKKATKRAEKQASRAAQKQAKNISANVADTLEESIIKRRSGIEEAFSKGVRAGTSENAMYFSKDSQILQSYVDNAMKQAGHQEVDIDTLLKVLKILKAIKTLKLMQVQIKRRQKEQEIWVEHHLILIVVNELIYLALLQNNTLQEN